MRRTPLLKQAAITLTELLVVLVIIGILSTTALPVYINQAERARQAAARQECYELAQAMDACGIEHGRYVPLQVLDDLPGDGTGGIGSNADVIQRESTGLFAINFGVPVRDLDTAIGNPPLISSTDPGTINMVENWKGPFINFQRFFVPLNFTELDLNQQDFPLDPWGNPYRFYSPLGIVGSMNTGASGTFSLSDFSGNISAGTDDRFDRWAIVSWGPDGVSQNQSGGSGNNDDIVYFFGFANSNETDFNATP